MTYLFELTRATWLIFTMQLGTISRSRRTLVGLVLAAIPPLLGFLVARLTAGNVTGARAFATLGTMLLVGFIVPMLGVALGVGAIADEAESRTITYPFTRPIPRASLFLGRWLATVVVILILVGSSGIGLFAMTATIPDAMDFAMAAPLLGAALIGGIIYSLGAAVIGVMFKRGLIYALGYAFAMEVLLANIPGSSQRVTVQYHLRSIFVDKDVEVWTRVGTTGLTTFLPPTEALTKMLVVVVLLVVFGAWRVTRKQFVLAA